MSLSLAHVLFERYCLKVSLTCHFLFRDKLRNVDVFKAKTIGMSDLKKYAMSRGGAKMKSVAFENTLYAAERGPSKLVRELLDLWQWGHMSAVILQKIAQAASDDLRERFDADIQEWNVLAELGACGANPQNVRRDLMRKLPRNMFPVMQCRLPIRLSPHKSLRVATARLNVPVILPETLWNGIFASGNEERFAVTSRQAVESFWNEVGASHPALVNRPIKAMAGYKHRAVPVVLHGDGAAITQQIGSNSKSCLFLSFRSLTAADCNRHFLMAAVWTSAISKGAAFNTVNSLLRILSDNFAKLAHDGGEASNEYFPLVVFTTGDLEYFADFHAVPRWNSNFPCALCGVRKEALGNYKRVSQLDADTWHPPRPHTWPCPLFESLMSPQSICPDLMHSKHLGTDLRLIGSVVWVLIFDVMAVSPLEERMASLLHDLHAASLQLSCPNVNVHVSLSTFLFLMSLSLCLSLRNTGVERSKGRVSTI